MNRSKPTTRTWQGREPGILDDYRYGHAPERIQRSYGISRQELAQLVEEAGLAPREEVRAAEAFPPGTTAMDVVAYGLLEYRFKPQVDRYQALRIPHLPPELAAALHHLPPELAGISHLMPLLGTALNAPRGAQTPPARRPVRPAAPRTAPASVPDTPPPDTI